MNLLVYITDEKQELNVRVEGEDSIFLRNVGFHRRFYTAPKPRNISSSGNLIL
jgi:hypothetical protein